MLKIITFKRNTAFLGRNGYFKCSGLEISRDGDLVQLQPVTSKGLTGRCLIEIPAEHVVEVLRAMKAKG